MHALSIYARTLPYSARAACMQAPSMRASCMQARTLSGSVRACIHADRTDRQTGLTSTWMHTYIHANKQPKHTCVRETCRHADMKTCRHMHVHDMYYIMYHFRRHLKSAYLQYFRPKYSSKYRSCCGWKIPTWTQHLTKMTVSTCATPHRAIATLTSLCPPRRLAAPAAKSGAILERRI